MKILVDTHILIWLHTDTKKVSSKALKILKDSQNEFFYSTVNIWEVQIKHLAHPKEFTITGEDLHKLSIEAGLQTLNIKPSHCIELKNLVFDELNAPRQHKDPFDKILICQAKVENMLLMTHDSLIPFYNEPCILQV